MILLERTVLGAPTQPAQAGQFAQGHGVYSHLARVDDRAFVFMHDFNRILDRRNVAGCVFIAVIEHGVAHTPEFPDSPYKGFSTKPMTRPFSVTVTLPGCMPRLSIMARSCGRNWCSTTSCSA
jgi:hypothetical protein